MTTVATVDLMEGQLVYTTAVIGEDFGLSLVGPNCRIHGRHIRTVRSVLRASGGRVVRFMDGTKTEPINGRTVWMVAEPHLGDPREMESQ